MLSTVAVASPFLSTLPARGATHFAHGLCCPATYFYPRSPRGERLATTDSVTTGYQIFLSTLPARGATRRAFAYEIHHTHFYPRSPRGERRGGGTCREHTRHISIHAPREGSDSSTTLIDWGKTHFYPRSPRGERLSLYEDTGLEPEDFYPRSPRGERRCCSISFFLLFQYFYPRSPRGERL